MRKILGIVAAVAIVAALASCEREPALFLCDHHISGPARVAVDWSHFLHKQTPTGMTLKLFQLTDSGYRLHSSTSTNDITHVDYTLPAGTYADFVINQSEDEFGSATFSHMDNWQLAEVSTTQAASKWYKDTITTDPLVSNVEWIGTDRHSGVPLTQATLDSAAGALVTIDTLHPRNIVSTITVYVHIKNVGSLRSARSALDGLASGFLLGQGHTTTDKVTQLLESWHLTIDSTAANGMQYGTIVARISSFGLPYLHGGQPDENTLHLDCLLKNDSILSFDYLVGDKFYFDYDDNADLHFTIDITMEEPLPDIPDTPDDNGSGFEVTVEDWGDEQPIVIPF